MRNPSEKSARYEIKAVLPKVLGTRLEAILDQRKTTLSFGLGPSVSRTVTVELKPGAEFTPEQVKQARGGRIRLSVFADGNVIGGMSYELDHTLQQAPREQVGAPPIGLDHAEIEKPSATHRKMARVSMK